MFCGSITKSLSRQVPQYSYGLPENLTHMFFFQHMLEHDHKAKFEVSDDTFSSLKLLFSLLLQSCYFVIWVTEMRETN